MPQDTAAGQRDLYVIVGPSGYGQTTLMQHVATTFNNIKLKDESFDHVLLTISDDYAFAPPEELVQDNVIISGNTILLQEYSF